MGPTAVAAVGTFLNNRARARAFEQALSNPESIQRIVRLSIRTRSGTFPHVENAGPDSEARG